MSWNLQFPHAQFLTDTLSIDVDMKSRFRLSVFDQGSNSTDKVTEALLSVEIMPSESELPLNVEPLACGDSYVRESDLIAIYPQQYPWPFSYQVDVRVRTDLPSDLRAIELWLSVSTSMLDCTPKLHLIPQTSLKQSSSIEIAVASHGRAALIVHPLDAADCEAKSSSDFAGVGLWDVFGGFMEKGVIRRSRFLCVWSSVVEPMNRWEQALEWFAKSPLPLTA